MRTLKDIDATHKIETGIYKDPRGGEHEMLYFNSYTMTDPIKALKKEFLADKITQTEYFARKAEIADTTPVLTLNKFISKSFSKSKLQLILDNLDIIREFVNS